MPPTPPPHPHPHLHPTHPASQAGIPSHTTAPPYPLAKPQPNPILPPHPRDQPQVTPWNVEKLREAVLLGPGRNPGAVAVEDERGRIVVLRGDRKVGLSALRFSCFL